MKVICLIILSLVLSACSTPSRSKEVVIAPTQYVPPAPRATEIPRPTQPPPPTSTPEIYNPPSYTYVVATEAINIRSGPGTNYAVVGGLRGGESIRSLGAANSEWTKVEHQGNTAYVYSALVGRPGSQRFAPSQPAPQPIPQQPQPAPPPQQSGCPNGCSSPPAGCNIKGNISFNTGEKIYHVPGGRDYAATVINSSQGERWFCTEQEALNNDWRRSLK